jgi:hypothetical protein
MIEQDRNVRKELCQLCGLIKLTARISDGWPDRRYIRADGLRARELPECIRAPTDSVA